MADPNLHYFDGKFTMWATHDFSVNTGFTMKDWWIWSSPDLVEWTKEAVVSPQQSLKWDRLTSAGRPMLRSWVASTTSTSVPEADRSGLCPRPASRARGPIRSGSRC